jgi:hypothetical protein
MTMSSFSGQGDLDTATLAHKVRHYLKYNQIHHTRFASLMLGISQSRLSILLGKPWPWTELSRWVQVLYERMQLWMETRATYGNNPYQREKKVVKKTRGKVATKMTKRPRSLFEVQENVELLMKQEDLTAVQNIVEESDTE